MFCVFIIKPILHVASHIPQNRIVYCADCGGRGCNTPSPKKSQGRGPISQRGAPNTGIAEHVKYLGIV